MGSERIPPAWPLVGRVLFRFAFAYLLLFNLFGGNSLLGQLWDPIVLWVGQIVFGVTITVRPLGSGDTTWNYVQLFCFLILAFVTTLVWSLFDRKRPHYERLGEWLRVIARYSLAMTMILYGIAKVDQFPSPIFETLLQPIGETTPMGLLWTFMGASPAYTSFTGVIEVLGGLLLIFRRTTLLGALISLAAMSQVVLLNFCYDVPVKILSSHLLLMAAFLLLPDLRRLADLFVFNRRVEPAADRPLFTGWMNVAGLVTRTGLFAAFITLQVFAAVVLSMAMGQFTEKPPLYGAWKVESFDIDGEARPPLLTDDARWRRVIVSFPGAIGIQSMNDTTKYYLFALDEAAGTWTLTNPKKEEWRSVFTYRETEPGVIALEGSFDGRSTRATLKRVDRADFVLVNRGFHWINETPFNSKLSGN